MLTIVQSLMLDKAMNQCIFCQIVEGSAKSWKVYETESTYAFFDINPVNEYHTLVVPKHHYTDMFDIPEAELKEVIATVKHIVDIYHTKLGIENIQLFNNSGILAQQDVFHLHFHIVPRYEGDKKNIRWKTHPELRDQFEQMLGKLK